MKYEKAAHNSLINAIVDTDAALDGQRHPQYRRLLLLTILIKYLEDRRVFPEAGWFGRFQKGARTFLDVLEAGNPQSVCRLLRFLEDRFNGDIFRAPGGSDWRLTNSSLRHFAELVEARTIKRQRYLWEQFSFEHVPVEVISHLYQRFVTGGHGTVYTPPMLASLLLDHIMPYPQMTGDERVLDPACGSGVFLVGTFRRLVNVWRAQNDWQRPNVETLNAILARSIFGIELEPGAVDLAAFSLAMALCDALQGKTIWRHLRFNRLRNTNLVEADFFDILTRHRAGESTILGKAFDIVVGNPPFQSTLTEAGTRLNESVRGRDGKLPDQQAAYLFLEQAPSCLREGARLCLIQPAGFLYNRKVESFRRQLLQNYRVDTVFDFTSISGLFRGARSKALAVSLQHTAPNDSDVVAHLTFRRTVSAKERICFELDHYDRHLVPQEVAETDRSVWRTNLLGGGRLLDMVGRARSMRTLAQFIDAKQWDCGEGFIAGTNHPKDDSKKKREEATYLTGRPLLPTNAINETGIDEGQITVVTDTEFQWPRREALFSAPLVLIREHASLPMAYWDKGPLAYRDKIVGIHAESGESEQLRSLFSCLIRHRKAYRFWIIVTGSQELIGRATAVLKADILSLPYPERMRDFEFSFWEQALRDDVLEFMPDLVRLGQNSKLLKTRAGARELQAYAAMFCRMLGTVYHNLRAGEPVFLNGLVCQPFFFGDHAAVDWLDESDCADHLETLVYEQHHETLRTVRVVRFYDENVLFIVKPDRLRYWIRSAAIQDADETLVDLRDQGW